MKLNIVHYKAVGTPRPTPLLLVHGAWHASWSWENFVPFFTGLGYDVTTVDLRGHGGSEGREKVKWHSAARGYVADVAQAVEAIGRPPVIIAHSLGGYVAQKYLENNTVPAAVLIASVPARGILGFSAEFYSASSRADPENCLNLKSVAHGRHTCTDARRLLFAGSPCGGGRAAFSALTARNHSSRFPKWR